MHPAISAISIRKPKNLPCHGCGGKGWVPVNGNARICPICLGSGKEQRPKIPYIKWQQVVRHEQETDRLLLVE